MLSEGIPLAYINPEIDDYEYKINIESIFSGSNEITVYPYQQFNDLDQYLFNKDKVKLNESKLLRRIGDKYYYIPDDMIEFLPSTFKFSMIIKKQLEYLTDRFYNLRISCSTLDSITANRLLSIFGDAPKRGVCPSNISVNNQDKTLESLIGSASYLDLDFLFISSDNGYYYTDTTKAIDFEEILSNNVSIWLSVKSFEGVLKEKEERESMAPTTITASDPTMYNIAEYPVDYHNYFFDLNEVHSRFNPEVYDYETIFVGDSPILIIHRDKCGYIIVSHYSLLENISANCKIIYETLMNVYLKDYIRYDSGELWITKQLVDLIQLNNKPYNRYHEEIPINTLITTKDCVIDVYSLIQVTTDNENIVFSGINQKDGISYLNFSKKELLGEPLKEITDVFYLSNNKKTIFKYTNSVVKLIETGISIVATKTDTYDYITISPCISSLHKIYSNKPQNILIPDTYENIYVFHKDNVFYIKDNGDCEDTLVAVINKIGTKVVKNIDIRLLGGGIPEKMADDYDLLDIGHPKGKPYRLGSTLIIELPKRLEKYSQIIEKEVYKHSIAGELVTFVFKN